MVEVQQVENRENRIFWLGFGFFCIGAVPLSQRGYYEPRNKSLLPGGATIPIANAPRLGEAGEAGGPSWGA